MRRDMPLFTNMIENDERWVVFEKPLKVADNTVSFVRLLFRIEQVPNVFALMTGKSLVIDAGAANYTNVTKDEDINWPVDPAKIEFLWDVYKGSLTRTRCLSSNIVAATSNPTVFLSFQSKTAQQCFWTIRRIMVTDSAIINHHYNSFINLLQTCTREHSIAMT